MIPMHRKFNDDIFARFLVIMKNVVINFLAEVIPEVEYTRKVAISISDILSLWSTLWLKY